MNAHDNTHARIDPSDALQAARHVRAGGLADRAESRVFFNGGCEPRHAKTGDGLHSGAPGRDTATSVEKHARREPPELLHELGILAAIAAFPSVLARFKALGVGPDIFAWPAIALLARFVMSWDRSDPLTVLREHADAMLDPLDGRGLVLGDELEDRVAVLRACPKGDAWALRDLDRSLAALVRCWLPVVLRHLADMYEHGDTANAERLVLSMVRFISTTGDIS